MRSALRTSCADRDLALALEVRRAGSPGAATCGCCSRSSAASSIVMMRSPPSTNDESTLSSVVLPDPCHRSRRCCAGHDGLAQEAASVAPSASRSRPGRRARSPRRRKRRIVSSGPSRLSGGITQFTREPSGRRASTSGAGLVHPAPERAQDPLDHVHAAPRRTRTRRRSRSIRPSRSTSTGAGPLTMISSTARVLHQRLQRAEAQRAREHALARAPRAALVERLRLLVQQGRRYGRAVLPDRSADRETSRASSTSRRRRPWRGRRWRSSRQIRSRDCDTSPSRAVSPAARGRGAARGRSSGRRSAATACRKRDAQRRGRAGPLPSAGTAGGGEVDQLDR